jgi:hypothetical protein
MMVDEVAVVTVVVETVVVETVVVETEPAMMVEVSKEEMVVVVTAEEVKEKYWEVYNKRWVAFGI